LKLSVPVSHDSVKGGWASSGAVTNLTHTVGTADGTIDDVGASFSQSILNNNFKELSAKLNAILVALRDAGTIVS
jgi:uncharacterized tellurite resistance protein B-like protein